MLLARVRRATHVDRKHQVLGHPDRLEAQALRLEGHVEVESRVESAQGDAELHVRVPRSARSLCVSGGVHAQIRVRDAAHEGHSVVAPSALHGYVLVEHVLLHALRIALVGIAPASPTAEAVLVGLAGLERDHVRGVGDPFGPLRPHAQREAVGLPGRPPATPGIGYSCPPGR